MTVSIPSIQVWDDAVANVRRIKEETGRPGRRLIFAAAIGLGVLDLGLFAVSLKAQYHYVFAAKHESWAAYIESGALDAGMVIFSLLAMGLALAGQSARTERAMIVLCAAGSAAMNYGAADVGSLRSIAAYVMPSIFFAVVTDRVIAVVRRHVLGLEAEQSPWGGIGRAILFIPRVLALIVLYILRLLLAPKSTTTGMRRWVLQSTPLPAPPAAVVIAAVPPAGDHLDEIAPGDRKALPPGSCIAELDSGEPCGKARPCTRHEPEVAVPGETRKQHLLRLYADHPRHADRAWASRTANELAAHVQLSEGAARNYVNVYLAELDAAQAEEGVA